MPIPSRKSGEELQKYISRCIAAISDEYETSQAAAICYSKSKEKMAEENVVYVLKPRRSENRGSYLSRCTKNNKMRLQYPSLKERSNFCLTSFNEYYRYWAKSSEFGDIPKDSNLGACIAKERASGADYRTAYASCATRVVAPSGPVVLSEDNLLIEPVLFAGLDILGYNTKHFDICPGAQETFKHLIEMNPDEETAGMIRSAAQIADNIFEIEKKVIENKSATELELNEAILLVNDFYDLMHEIDEEVGMAHDVSYMEGHLEIIESYLD